MNHCYKLWLDSILMPNLWNYKWGNTNIITNSEYKTSTNRGSKPSLIKKLGIRVILTQGKDALGFKYFWSVCSLQLPSNRGATAFKQIIELNHNYLVRNKKKYHVSNLHQYHFKRQKKKSSFIFKTTKQKKNADILLYLELYIWKRLSQPVWLYICFLFISRTGCQVTIKWINQIGTNNIWEWMK